MQLARKGACPVVFDRNPLTDDFADQLKTLCPRTRIELLQLTDDAACARAVTVTIDSLGGIDGL